MSWDSTSIDLDLIREQVSLPALLSLYSIPSNQNIRCLWHEDHQPSMQIFKDHGWCYSCRKYADIFSFVMKLEKINFDRAVAWIIEHKGIVPETIIQKAPKEYLGVLPISIAKYWHDQLTSDRRQYLYDRLLLDDTLDRYLIGFRPDFNAYTIPYWSDVPGKSEIVSLQYRAAPNSDSSRKYWWERGRYTPCIFNQHLINNEMNVLVFGTFDALLGAQDRLPMLSASGLNTFANAKKAESIMLRELLRNTERTIILPDGTQVEFEAATEVMYSVEGEIKYFPYYVPKDYTDYRKAGYTRENFIDEVLEMPSWKYNHLYAVEGQHLEPIAQMLEQVSKGEKVEAFKLMQKVVREGQYGYGCIVQSLAMEALRGPQYFGGVFNSDEWSAFIDELEESNSYPDITVVIGKYGDIAAARVGGF